MHTVFKYFRSLPVLSFTPIRLIVFPFFGSLTCFQNFFYAIKTFHKLSHYFFCSTELYIDSWVLILHFELTQTLHSNLDFGIQNFLLGLPPPTSDSNSIVFILKFQLSTPTQVFNFFFDSLQLRFTAPTPTPLPVYLCTKVFIWNA